MSEPKGRARRSKEDRRQEILDKARELVIERGTPERIDIRLRDVLDELGLTTGAGYHIWENQEAFQLDLAAEIARNVSFASLLSAGIAPDFERPALDEVKRMGEAYFEIFVESDNFYAALRFWGAKGLSDVVVDGILQGYTQNRGDWIEFFEAGLAWAGLELLDEFDIEDLATSVTLITEGAALRHRFDPDALRTRGGAHLYGELLVATITHMTRVVDSDGASG